MENILSCKNFNRETIDLILDFCYKSGDKLKLEYSNETPILVNVFYEPSTRTSLSFESAMNKLGGRTITFNKEVSSLKKGESFEDTIRTLSIYGNILVLRHPEKGMVEKASKYSKVPIINGGDGNGEHPTQALLDLYTIYERFGKDFENKKILLIGDIKNSRTIHSLLDLLKFYPKIKPENVSVIYNGVDDSFFPEKSVH